MKVAVVEKATFPHDTLSSHVFEADGLGFLNRLGVGDELRDTGAVFANRIEVTMEDVQLDAPLPTRSGDLAGFGSVRRTVLDPILARAAEEAGAEVRMGTKVTGLVQEGGRVRGVRAGGDGGDVELRASLVVGADGRDSTVARLTGSRRYNLTPNERAIYWAYYEGADPGPDPAFLFHRRGSRFLLALPTDGGLYQVLVWMELSELDSFRRDSDGHFMDHVRSSPAISRAVEGARRVGKFVGSSRWTGFFREASGPGWVLAGDAGHFKDPAPGRGIGDAFIQAETLAPAIVAGLDGSGGGIDAAMARWGRGRDREFAEHYWFATDMGKSGAVPAVLPAMMRGLVDTGKAHVFLDLLAHRAKPSQLLTPPRLAKSTARAVRDNPGSRGAVLREVASLGAEEARRRWWNRRPVYEDAAASAGGA